MQYGVELGKFTTGRDRATRRVEHLGVVGAEKTRHRDRDDDRDDKHRNAQLDKREAVRAPADLTASCQRRLHSLPDRQAPVRKDRKWLCYAAPDSGKRNHGSTDPS